MPRKAQATSKTLAAAPASEASTAKAGPAYWLFKLGL